MCVCIYIVYIFYYHPPKHLFLFSLSIIMTKDGKTLPICQEPNLTCSCLVWVLLAFGKGQCTCDSIPPYFVAILNCNNQSVIRIAHNDVFHKHKKHIEIIVIWVIICNIEHFIFVLFLPLCNWLMSLPNCFVHLSPNLSSSLNYHLQFEEPC